jgi:hypothetical protein
MGSNWGKLSITLFIVLVTTWSRWNFQSPLGVRCPAELRMNGDVSVRQEQAKRVVFYDALTRLIRLSLGSPPVSERQLARPVQHILSLGSNCSCRYSMMLTGGAACQSA